MGANAGGSSLDPIGPAVCLRTMSNGQALDLELNAVDGGGGHAVGLFETIVAPQGRVARVETLRSN